MGGETEKEISGWTVDTLKILLQQDISALRGELSTLKESIELARREMDRRLGELNQLRKEVTDDRSELVQKQAYEPAIKELQKQIGELGGKALILAGDVANNATDIAAMKNSLTWLTRLIAGALILGIIAFGFRALTGR